MGGFPKLFDEHEQSLKEKQIRESEVLPSVVKKEMAFFEAMAIVDHAFPRIAHMIEMLWTRKECDDYIDSLIFDQRGDRQGFPKPVLQALLVLSKVHHREYGHHGKAGDKWVDTYSR